MSCSRTHHGGGRSRTPDLSLRSPTLYHWATALPSSRMEKSTLIRMEKSTRQIWILLLCQTVCMPQIWQSSELRDSSLGNNISVSSSHTQGLARYHNPKYSYTQWKTEPWHDKSNIMCARPVWSESSLCAWRVVKDPRFLPADSEDWSDWVDAQADQSSLGAHSLCWFCHVVVQLLL